MRWRQGTGDGDRGDKEFEETGNGEEGTRETRVQEMEKGDRADEGT